MCLINLLLSNSIHYEWLINRFISITSLPDPEKDTISLRKVEGGTAAVLKFSGKPTENVVLEKKRVLRSSLLTDGLKPRKGCLLARYNDPGRTRSFVMVCSVSTLQAHNYYLHIIHYFNRC